MSELEKALLGLETFNRIQKRTNKADRGISSDDKERLNEELSECIKAIVQVTGESVQKQADEDTDSSPWDPFDD